MEEQDRGIPSILTFAPVQIFVGVLLFVALLNGQRDLTILALLVLGVIGGTRLWARMSQWNTSFHLTLDKRKVFPGEKITVTASAENAKPLPIWLNAHIPIGNLDAAGVRALTQATSLMWYQQTHLHWELIPEHRGVYPIGPLNILTGDLFSFFSKHTRGKESYTLIVYPRLVKLKSFTLPGRDFFGVTKAPSPVQDPVYILGTRDYQHTQPAKFIHWKASARHNHLQEKVFEPTVQEKVLLAVNVDSFVKHDAEQDWERTLQAVAAMAARFDRQNHAVGFAANGVVKEKNLALVPIARNEHQVASILEMLARLEMRTDNDLQGLLRRGLANAWGASCIYFSYQDDETVLVAQDYFAQRKIPTLFVVCQRDASFKRTRKIYSLEDICFESERK